MSHMTAGVSAKYARSRSPTRYATHPQLAPLAEGRRHTLYDWHRRRRIIGSWTKPKQPYFYANLYRLGNTTAYN